MYAPEDDRHDELALGRLVGMLAEDAEKRLGADRLTAIGAAAATEKAMRGRVRASRLDAIEQRRVRAYFAAVLRSLAFKRGRRADSRYRTRLKVVSLVEDLRSVGTPAERIREEVVSFYGEGALSLLGAADVA